MTFEALITDAKVLTELTIRSKSHRNYGRGQIEAWIDELTITEDYIDENEIFKFGKDNVLIGFYAYAPEEHRKIRKFNQKSIPADHSEVNKTDN